MRGGGDDEDGKSTGRGILMVVYDDRLFVM